ncbi:MAG: hypothetical protein HYY35_02290 [Deltaproteobacteria bacterium]|nr:hypothetical protein [Deltaproteobacteria bacterium]
MNADAVTRFAADKMLGRLARWLRILGCDVLYGPSLSGRSLLSAARRERRVVLTRDRRLARRADAPSLLLVEDDRFREQVRQVVSAFAIDVRAGLFRRCVECNGDLEEVPREAAAGRVPEFVLSTQQRFRRCARCGHLYWDATHVARVRRELAGMGIAPAAGATENAC